MQPTAKAALWCVFGLSAGFFAGRTTGTAVSQGYPSTEQAGGATESQTMTLPPGGGSLFHQKFGQMANQSPEGRSAGQHVFRSVMFGDLTGCPAANAIWDSIPKGENFGGEYESLRWLCQYTISTPETQIQMAKDDPDGASLVRYFERVGWRGLGQYLGNVYKFEAMGLTAVSNDFVVTTHETLRFSGPGRAAWERTDELMARIGINPGSVVVDLGAGGGFITRRMSQLVGARGKVVALEISGEFLKILQFEKLALHQSNVDIVESKPTDLGLPANSADVIWICNLYHYFYAASSDEDRAALLKSMRTVLRPGGRLIVADQTPAARLPSGEPRYFGFAIDPELVRLQLEYAGFVFQRQIESVPQRYVLSFSDPT